ncbi:MAG: DNA/RNA non-specific endonuclease [Allosphingosinicella sp.]
MRAPLRALLALAAFGFVPLCAAPAAAAACTAAEKAEGNRILASFSSDPTKVAAAVAAHLPWGAPVPTMPTTHERMLVQDDYVIDYDDSLRVPIWTAERIQRGRLDEGIARQDCFRADPRLSADASSAPSDYAEPIYDQGHMTPFADQRYSKMAGINSFVMTNMAPQNCQLNRGIWQILEQITRRWAARHDDLYVFNGSVFDRDGNGVRDPDSAATHMRSNNGRERVAVPSAFFKVIAFRQPDGTVETLSVMLPHDTSNPNGQAALTYLSQHITDLATLERLMGLDLFPGATRIHENHSLWTFDGYKPSSLCHARAQPAAGSGGGGR